MKEIDAEVTDWTAYYSKPKSKFSTVTQKATLSKLLLYLEKYEKGPCNIIELGGGNSCFAKDIFAKCKVPINNYSIIDNCNVAVEKFKMMALPGDAYLADLTSDGALERINKHFDVVYSVGLIEHFRGDNIKKIINAHFQLCKPGGMVLISVPTPTTQYCFFRKAMEILKVWGFPDEKPLRYEDISDVIEKQGKVVEREINKKLPLTQLIVIAIKPTESISSVNN